MSSIPDFGLGTFRLKGQVVIDSVLDALDVGYRAIDTAQIYDNEAEVGQAIAESGVARDDLFLTTKVWIANFSHDALLDSLRESLRKLRTDHVDLTLIHWPSPKGAVPVAEFMGALLEAKRQDLVHSRSTQRVVLGGTSSPASFLTTPTFDCCSRPKSAKACQPHTNGRWSRGSVAW